MRSENMAKIAINAVRLPKFEDLYRKSWSVRTIMIWYLPSHLRLKWFCACADNSVWSFTQGQYGPTIVEPYELYMNRQIGVRDFTYVGIICPLCIGHVIRRMRSGYKRILSMVSHRGKMDISPLDIRPAQNFTWRTFASPRSSNKVCTEVVHVTFG